MDLSNAYIGLLTEPAKAFSMFPEPPRFPGPPRNPTKKQLIVMLAVMGLLVVWMVINAPR